MLIWNGIQSFSLCCNMCQGNNWGGNFWNVLGTSVEILSRTDLVSLWHLGGHGYVDFMSFWTMGKLFCWQEDLHQINVGGVDGNCTHCICSFVTAWWPSNGKPKLGKHCLFSPIRPSRQCRLKDHPPDALSWNACNLPAITSNDSEVATNKYDTALTTDWTCGDATFSVSFHADVTVSPCTFR